MDAERCVCCGDVIPEGRMVCPNCNGHITKVGSLLQSRDATKEEVKKAYEWLHSDLDETIDMC